MEIRIEPERIIPAIYQVSFWEFDYYYDENNSQVNVSYTDYLVELGPYQVSLRPDIIKWLDENAAGYYVQYDYGDFGDGPLCVKIDFLNETSMYKWIERYKR